MTDPGEAFVVERLSVRYGSLTAVDDVSSTVATGETFALVGPNGAGKTSLVECLSGQRAPSAGRALAFGVDPRHDRTQATTLVGVQLQDANFPRRIRVDEVCRLFASFYPDPASIDELLAMFDLSGHRRSLVRTLSGCQRQRLSIVLALLGRPRALLLDELTAGLDPQVRRATWRRVRNLAEQGLSIVMTSHYMDEVEALRDRVALLRRGRIEACGTVGELVRRYGGHHRYVLDGAAARLVTLDELVELPPVAAVAPNERAATVMANLLYFPMIFLTGATIPLRLLPSGMRYVAEALPRTDVWSSLSGVGLVAQTGPTSGLRVHPIPGPELFVEAGWRVASCVLLMLAL